MVIITPEAIERRAYWVSEIVKISGNFGQDATRVERELSDEVAKAGGIVVLDHLRLSGAIPESYGHDSSEEKLYSKYTDALLAVAFRVIGLSATVVIERADAADVQVVGPSYDFVADAKAFRLSRTAKNQKDFKVEAMAGWKRGMTHAIVVCPLHQFPARVSQIYQQAIARDVCLLSYSHIAILVAYSLESDGASASELLGEVLRSINMLNPTKDALSYWSAVNRTFLGHDFKIKRFWDMEKLAHLEALVVAKEEALSYLANERASILKLSREEAVSRLISERNIDGRMRVVHSNADNGLLAAS